MKGPSRISLVILFSASVHAQSSGPNVEWSTSRGDAQGSSWLRSDAFISPERMRAKSPVFELQWKLKLSNEQRQLNSLTPAVTIGGAGRFPLSVVGGSSNNFHGFDNVSGIEIWDRQFEAPAVAGTLACPAGIAASGARPAPLVPPAPSTPPPLGGLFPFYGGTFGGGVGAPGEGIPPELMAFRRFPSGAGRTTPAILKLLDAMMTQPGQEPRGGPEAPAPASPPGRGGPSYFGGAYVVASDGVLHSLGPLAGKDVLKPVPFLPPNAHASDLVAVENMLYAATLNGCGGVPNGVWAIDLSGPEKPVISWKTDGGSPVGAPVVSSDGTVFVAIDGAASGIVALDGKTLARKDWFTQRAAGVVSTPVIFKYKDREMIAAVAGGGRILLLDTASLGGADHQTPLAISAAVSGYRPDFKPAALASWEDPGGTRWILMPVARPTGGAIVAFKVVGEAIHPTLQQSWVSRDLVSPLAPIVVNGVIFAASGGEYHPASGVSTEAERVRRSIPAVVYALDADTGKELWSSGKAVTSFVHSGGLWAGGGQVYLSTYDNTVYAFGYAMGRH